MTHVIMLVKLSRGGCKKRRFLFTYINLFSTSVPVSRIFSACTDIASDARRSLHKTRSGARSGPLYSRLGQCYAGNYKANTKMVSHSAACGFALPTLTIGVILLRRLRLALRQYNLTLELLQLRLELV